MQEHHPARERLSLLLEEKVPLQRRMWCSPEGALPQYGFADRYQFKQCSTAPHISQKS